MRIIDTFPYFNEKELLELRIRMLYDYVDRFIIIDANRTHKGDLKPYTCRKTLEELGLYDDKILIIEAELPGVEEEPDCWIRERMQRDFAEFFIEEDDVCIVSDCDEIIDPKFINYYVDVAKKYPENILRIPMVLLISRADLRAYNNGNPVSWDSPFICLKSHLENHTLSEIRESRAYQKNNLKYSDIFIAEDNIIKESGWHFSWMGGKTRIEIKSKTFLHWNEVSLKENYVPKENSTDPLGREDHILKKYSKNLLPQKIFNLIHIKEFLFHGQENETGIIEKNLSHVNSNYNFAFDYLNSKFDLDSKKHRVIDIGAGANAWSIDWATHIVDKFVDPNDCDKFKDQDIKVFNIDIDDPREWESILKDVEENGKFDFVICSHVLEDINNPKIACEMINKIGKAGFISMPSKYSEMCIFEYKNSGLPYKGFHHHRWIYQIKNNVLIGYPKMNCYEYVPFEFDRIKGYSTEIAFLWKDQFDYQFIDCHQLLENRTGPNKLYDLFENDDLIL